MAGRILVAQTKKVARHQGLSRRNKGGGPSALYGPDGEAGAGFGGMLGGIAMSLVEKSKMGGRPPQRAIQQREGRFLDGRIVAFVPKHAIGGDGVVHVMRPFFPPLDFPGPDRRNLPEHLDKNVQPKVPAGEERTRRIVLRPVRTAAGLNATPSKAAFPAQIAAPITTPGDPVAESAVNEGFQANRFRTLGGHGLNFVHAEFAGQDHPGHPAGEGGKCQTGKGLRKTDVGQRGEMDFPAETRLIRQGDHAGVLNDQSVGLDRSSQFLNLPMERGQLLSPNQGVDRHVDFGVPPVGQFGEPGQFFHVEIFGGHARRKLLKTAVHRVGPGGQGGQKSVAIPRRGKNAGRSLGFGHGAPSSGRSAANRAMSSSERGVS